MMETVAHREPRNDVYAGLACLVLGLVALHVAGNPAYWAGMMRGGLAGPPLGKVFHKLGTVRLRESQGSGWLDFLGGERPVADGDAIFTAAEGEAELVLDGVGSARILPGSLVIVRAPDADSGNAAWLAGLFAAKARAPSIEVRRGKLQPAADFKARITEAAPPRAATAQAGSPLVRQPADIALETAEAPAPVAALKPLAPVDNQVQYAAPGTPLEFRWETPAGSAQRLVFELSGDQWSRTHLAAGASTHQLALGAGRYGWRVRPASAGQELDDAPWAYFTVEQPGTPEPKQPESELRLTADDAGRAKVTLTWQLPTGAARSELSISGGEPRIVEGESLEVALPPGGYQWRVRALFKGGTASEWSEPRTFTVARSGRDFIPRLTPAIELGKYKAKPNAVEVKLRWKSVPDATEYHVVVTGRDSGKVLDRKLEGTSATFDAGSLDERYDISVRAMQRSGEEVIGVPLSYSVPLNPPERGTAFRDKASTIFSWKRQLPALSYQVQGSYSADFSTIALDWNVTQNFVMLKKVLPPKTLYWRVRTLSRDASGPWSQANVLR